MVESIRRLQQQQLQSLQIDDHIRSGIFAVDAAYPEDDIVGPLNDPVDIEDVKPSKNVSFAVQKRERSPSPSSPKEKKVKLQSPPPKSELQPGCTRQCAKRTCRGCSCVRKYKRACHAGCGCGEKCANKFGRKPPPGE